MKAILAKLHAIMQDVSFIEKDGRNDFHKYNYASEFAIKTAVHAALVKHRVVFHATAAEVKTEQVTNAKGGREALTTTVMAYRFCDVDTGEYIEGQGIGQGQDPGDKGAYKAITGALKYILTTSLLIPTGDDPEGDDGTDKRASEQQKPASKPSKADPASKEPTEHEKAVETLRGLFSQLPEKKRTLETMRGILPISDFKQVQDCTVEQLKTGIDRINALLEGK
jgi:hypothetical protein